MKSFRKFILTSCMFFVLLMMMMVAIWKIVTWTRPSLCQKPNATILVMGNSRIQYGFDDSKVSGTWNVGLNADNYNIIYWKLKMLHRYNPQIRKVVLEVDNALIFNYFKGVEYKLHPYYWDEMNIQDWLTLIEKDRVILIYPFDWIKILYPIKSIFTSVSFQDLGIGGYTTLNRDKLQEDIQKNETKRKKTRNNLSNTSLIDELQFKYLNSIITYCQENNICLEFINMPSYPTKEVKHNNKELHQYIVQNYPSIPFHDYELIELPDSCYGDISHLNHKGANTLSEFLKRNIRK